jgi:recombination protein RecA
MSKGLEALTAAVKEPKEKEPKQPVKVLTKADKFEVLAALEKELNKQFDTTKSIVFLGSKVGVPVPSIKTNIQALDNDVLGCGGIPRGRIIEVFGPESSGKTTICLHIIACEQQSTDNLVAFVDAEHALDPTYAAKLGVNVDELLISQPDSGEQALETVEALIDSGTVSLIVVDSVAALVPQAELDGDMGDSHMGLQARLMSQAMRKLRGKAAMKGVTVIFINQIREKIGVMFGSPETTSGGRALKFFCSVRLDIRRKEVIKLGDEIIGHLIKVKAVKNKMAAPMKETDVRLLYGYGIDLYWHLVDYAVSKGVVEKSGSWYSYKAERIGQGLTNAANCVMLNPTIKQAIEKDLEKVIHAESTKEVVVG